MITSIPGRECHHAQRGTVSKFHNLIDKLLRLPTETYIEPWHLLLPRRQKELSSLSFPSLLPPKKRLF